MRNLTLPAILAVCCTVPLAHADATLDTISAQLTTLAQQNQSTANTLGHLSDQINAVANCGAQGKVWNGSACIAAATDAAGTGGMTIDLIKNDAFGASNDVVATYCRKHPIVDGSGYRLVTAQNNRCGADDACKALGYSGAASYTPSQMVTVRQRECGHDDCGSPTSLAPAQLRCFK